MTSWNHAQLFAACGAKKNSNKIKKQLEKEK
jgi:hypothetical protein